MAEPSIDKVLARLPFTAYTVGEVAHLVGRSVTTVRRWRKEGVFVPSVVLWQGDLRMPLYTDDDVARCKVIANSLRRGPKPKALRVASSR